MKQVKKVKKIGVKLCLALTALFLFLPVASSAQSKPLIKRTNYKTETVEFGVGGTVSIIGAPSGSIKIEGWQKNAVEISAEVEMEAATEADLAELAKVQGFVIDDDTGHIRITSVGTHDKTYMKRVAKNFPKNLLGMPFKVNYEIKVPMYSDINVDGGRGDFLLSNVEGAIRVNYLESNATLNLIGGSISATVGKGDVSVIVPNRSWRGRSVDMQVALGTLNVQLPLNLNANVTAQILRTGAIDNSLTSIKPRDRSKFTDKLIAGKTGVGGTDLNFTVGDGTMKLLETQK